MICATRSQTWAASLTKRQSLDFMLALQRLGGYRRRDRAHAGDTTLHPEHFSPNDFADRLCPLPLQHRSAPPSLLALAHAPPPDTFTARAALLARLMRIVLFWVAIVALVAFIGASGASRKMFAANPKNRPPGDRRTDRRLAERLTTGVRLLEEQKGERLLISGVNRIVTDAELYHALNVDPRSAHAASMSAAQRRIRKGNASETAAQARQHRYTDIILVTDDYHMPRSQAELEVALLEANIHPYRC